MKTAVILASFGLCACWNPPVLGDDEASSDTDGTGGEEATGEESGEPPAETSSSSANTDAPDSDTMDPSESSSGGPEPEPESSSEESTTAAEPVPVCGNMIVEGDEACDDGNLDGDDGCDGACQTPQVCEEAFDPAEGSAWVVCAATPSGAWVSSQGGGIYHPVAICQTLGYAGVLHWGETCGSVCGSCVDASSCDVPGQFDVIDWMEWNGGNCGVDALGELLCSDVTWICG